MNNMHTKINRQPALARQIADILQKEISAGMYAPGDVFPSENELAIRLDVSRTVIREALAHLNFDGILESRQGGRTRVSADLSQRVFRLDEKGQEEIDWIGHLYELRLIVESEAAALAAKRATKKDFQKIKKSFRAFEEAIESGEDGYQESKEFHRSILEASGNPHLSKLVQWIDAKIWSRPRDAKSNNRVAQRIHKEHMALIQAIHEMDVGKALWVKKDDKGLLAKTTVSGISIGAAKAPATKMPARLVRLGSKGSVRQKPKRSRQGNAQNNQRKFRTLELTRIPHGWGRMGFLKGELMMLSFLSTIHAPLRRSQAQWKTVMMPRGCWYRTVALLRYFVPFLEPPSKLFCL